MKYCWRILSVLAFMVWSVGSWADERGSSKPTLPPSAVRVGIQPLGVPSGVISSVMQRDRLLQRFMQSRGGISFDPFTKGADIVPLLASQQLQGGLLGDMPTLLATGTGQGVIVGLVKQTSTAIVGRGVAQVGELKGKRIGYVPMSSAHHTLLQGLRSAGMGEEQVNWVQLSVNEMADALARNEIDAFAAWEPVPSIALATNRSNRIIFQGRTNDYFVLDKHFVERQPEVALQVVAAFVRALEWMRASKLNLNKAVMWAQQDAKAFSGKASTISDEQVARITRIDILNVPAAPVIPARLINPPLRSEFEFLRALGKLPANAQWSNVFAALRYDGLSLVMEKPQEYSLSVFDYAD